MNRKLTLVGVAVMIVAILIYLGEASTSNAVRQGGPFLSIINSNAAFRILYRYWWAWDIIAFITGIGLLLAGLAS